MLVFVFEELDRLDFQDRKIRRSGEPKYGARFFDAVVLGYLRHLAEKVYGNCGCRQWSPNQHGKIFISYSCIAKTAYSKNLITRKTNRLRRQFIFLNTIGVPGRRRCRESKVFDLTWGLNARQSETYTDRSTTRLRFLVANVQMQS